MWEQLDGHFWLVAKVPIRFEWESWNSNFENYLIRRKVTHCTCQEYAVLWCCLSCWITTTTDSIPISFDFLMVKFVLRFLSVFEPFLESISKHFPTYLSILILKQCRLECIYKPNSRLPEFFPIDQWNRFK